MRPLIIDDELKANIAKLVEYAEKNPFTMDDLLDIYNKQMQPAGDMGPYTLVLQFGFKIVYTIEKQVNGDVRHLSISVDAPGKLPNPGVVEEIMRLIGFDNELSDCVIYLEDIGPNHQAINVLEVIEIK